MKPKVFIYPGDSYHSAIEMFSNRGFGVVKDFESVDLVCFLGGTDVDPAIYGEEPGPYTQAPDKMRDSIEVTDFGLWKSRDVPMVGICRGGQLLNVLNGGRMIQHLGEYISGDVDLFGYTEPGLAFESGYLGKVRVDHHQGIVAKDGAELAWPGGWFHPGGEVSYVAYYEDTKSLCFQAHPEWGHTGTEDYFFELIKTKIGLDGLVDLNGTYGSEGQV